MADRTARMRLAKPVSTFNAVFEPSTLAKSPRGLTVTHSFLLSLSLSLSLPTIGYSFRLGVEKCC